MPSIDLINKVAEAMKGRREELIEAPLRHVWFDLAVSAIDVVRNEMDTPSEKMVRAMPNYDPHEWNAMIESSPLGDTHD